MNINVIKIDKFKMAGIAAWLLFFVVVAYEVYFLHGVWASVNEQQRVSAVLHVIKIDKTGLDTAVSRYNNAVNYNFSGPPMADPFSVQVKTQN